MKTHDTGTDASDPAASCTCCSPRREFLGKLAALGASAVLPGEALAQAAKRAAAPRKPFRVDVHHHLVFPGYLEAIGAQRAGSSPNWTPARSIEDMDKSGIAVSILSLIQPGVWTGDLETSRRLARESNEYGVQVARDHPGRFGNFAQLPLPDAEGSLKEIEYALDTLKVQGIGLMTSYQGKYLGDPAFAPVWEELNRRKALVYTHPLTPECCRNTVEGIPPGVVEYATDTTRTIASLVFSGTAAKYPDIRWIFSHGGGTMPFLLSRFTREEATMKERQKRLPHGVMYELNKFYYDTAQANHWAALAALFRLVPPTQVLYGTDFPFRPGAEVNQGLAQFHTKPKYLRLIERDNAMRLMPGLRA